MNESFDRSMREWARRVPATPAALAAERVVRALPPRASASGAGRRLAWRWAALMTVPAMAVLAVVATTRVMGPGPTGPPVRRPAIASLPRPAPPEPAALTPAARASNDAVVPTIASHSLPRRQASVAATSPLRSAATPPAPPPSVLVMMLDEKTTLYLILN